MSGVGGTLGKGFSDLGGAGFAVSEGSVPDCTGGRTITKQRVSFILPALNEGNSIERVIHRIPRKELENRGYGVSVWVLDGKSTDNTVDVAKENGANIYLQTGEGKGNAVSEVFGFLDSDYVVMLDADNTYDPRDVMPMMHFLENGHHIVMGSRMRGDMMDGAMSRKNLVGNVMLSTVAGMLYRRRVSDVCTGFWGFKGSVLRKLGIDAQGFELEAQLFSRASKLGLTIGEVPINYGTRHGDVTKLSGISSGVRIFWTLVRERLNGNGGRMNPCPASECREALRPSAAAMSGADD